MASLIKTIGGGIIAVGILFALLHYGARSYFTPITEPGTEQVSQAESDTTLVGARAPYFDLPDIAGNHHSVSDFSDTPLMIVFFATWNQAAADQIKILDDYLAAHADDESLVRIIAINTQEERSIVSSFIRRGGYRVETLIDAQGSVAEAYRIKSLPTAYFLDANGMVRSTYAGVMNAKAIESNIEDVLK
jgi:peroxiredoxin